MYLIKRNSFYYIRYFDEIENRIKQFSTKCKGKKDAHLILSNFQKEVKQKKRLNFIALDKFSKEYLEHVKILHSKKYHTSIDYTFKKLIETIGDIPLIRLDRNTLEKFLLETYEMAKHNAWLYFRNLRAAFNYAVTRHYLESNPIQSIKLPKLPEKLNLYISEVEFQSILNKTEGLLYKDLFKFAYNTGMRLGEIVNLKWNAVSFTEGIIKIESDESFQTKGNKSRIIPLNSTLFNILQSRMPKVIDITKDVYIFNSNKRKLYPDSVSRVFKQAVKDAGLNNDYHFHLLRASFISNLAKRNVPLAAIQKLCGHTSIKITERHYLSVQNDLLTSAMQTLDNNYSDKVSRNG